MQKASDDSDANKISRNRKKEDANDTKNPHYEKPQVTHEEWWRLDKWQIGRKKYP